ncbi:membrane protein [Clostridiales bacterium PH28_bin88]|nr:membrane protein [Clostridiales bacterium PH28_bin88]
MVLVVIATMALRRDTVLPCIVGLFVIGLAYSGSLVKTIQIMFNALTAAGAEFIGIITVISLVVAMSKAMTDVGTDYLIMRPAAKLMVNANVAFFVLGIAMMIVAWFVWPSPAVALIGALLLPVAVRAGLPVIGAAMAMNLFGHGIALSSDWIIQGAPKLTAQFAGLPDASGVTGPGAPLFFTMAIVTIGTAFYMLRKDMAKNKSKVDAEVLAYQQAAASAEVRKLSSVAYVSAILIPLVFIIDVIAMLRLDLKGGDATALIGGTALAMMALMAFGEFKGEALEKVTDYVRDGFMFGIKVFAPVIVIGGFFFLGSEGTAKAILGENATGLLSDLGNALAAAVPLSKAPVALIQMIVGGITGLDGSGFSGLPLVGSLAQTFGPSIDGNVGVLAALGQISAVWVGGGTVVPWGLIPVAAIAGVEPMELARRNFIPVMLGLLVTTIVAIVLL